MPVTNRTRMFPAYYGFRNSVFALLPYRFSTQGFLKQFWNIINYNPNINTRDFANQTILRANMYANKYGKYFRSLSNKDSNMWCLVQVKDLILQNNRLNNVKS